MEAANSKSGFWFRWTTWVVLAGLLLRGYHYLRNPPVWHDEAALIVNVLGKSFPGMFGTLFHHEAAPPLFLCLEKAVVVVLGDGTLALRLLPFLASCSSLLLLAWLAKRILRPEAVPWAVLLAAFSDRLLWHSCEAKPYAFDVFLGVALPALFLATQAWPLGRRLLLFAALAPVVVFLIFPGSFLCGGLLVAFLPAVWRGRSSRSWLAYAVLAAGVFGAFLLLTLGPIRAQRCGPMESCWAHTFPSWGHPWLLPWWSLKATVEVIDYCFRPLGGALIVLAVAGAVLLDRQGQGSLVAILVVPIATAWAAGLIHAYPYTGARVMVYALPALALLSAAAVPWALALLQHFGRQRWRILPLAGVLAGILLAPVLLSLYRVAVPWGRADWPGATDYVLRHYRPVDAVTSNSWEGEYYFRRLGSSYREMPSGAPEGERLWVVIMADTPEERRAVAEVLVRQDRRIVQEVPFESTTVYCLGLP